MQKAAEDMYGHELDFATAKKYQSPMRKPIAENEQRFNFMQDLQGDMGYKKLNQKWAKHPTIKLLYQKYIWGNRQKIALWSLINKKRNIF